MRGTVKSIVVTIVALVGAVLPAATSAFTSAVACGALALIVPSRSSTRRGPNLANPFGSNVHPVRDVAAAVAGSVSGVVKKVLGKGDAG